MAEQQFHTSVLRAIADFARRLKAVEYNLRKYKWGYPVLPPGVPQVVTVYKDGGAAGSASTSCTWTYTIKNLAGSTLDTLLSPHRPRFTNTIYTQAPDGSYGLAVKITGGWVLLVALQEIEQTDTC